MRIPTLLAAAALLPLPFTQVAQAADTSSSTPATATATTASTTTSTTAQAGGPQAGSTQPGSAQSNATQSGAAQNGSHNLGRRPGLPSTVGVAPHMLVGPAVRSAAGAEHRSGYSKDLSISVSPPSFPTAPGAVGTILVTICNNGTETPSSATLVVNGPANPGLTLTSNHTGVSGGWNWTRFQVAQNLAPSQCESEQIYGSTITGAPGPRSNPGGTAVVTWDPSQNPNDNSTTWSFDTSGPVTNAVLELWRPPKSAGPGNPADFEVIERNLGPSSDFTGHGQVVAKLPPGSKWLSSAPTYRPCTISPDGTTATCPDPEGTTWANFNRGFALQVDPAATPGSSIPVTLTREAPDNPNPHQFTLTVLIPVC
ncbi:hypothetical protein [Kitasatospora viridis]|uniref:Repeat protein (TIGR01451 family) n=1 Tax=Kitasatospora viridis TaxID=281105 RepID=A0A561UNL3_9ACTN|nr:hypothetical protein [Kitasatospora viridis]TWG00955.1 hypothetical protein FHX73_114836 [Kitasatospora viridis]